MSLFNHVVLVGIEVNHLNRCKIVKTNSNLSLGVIHKNTFTI